MLTTNPNATELKEGQQNKTGQHGIYLVLSEEERSKGFIRPVRTSYIHIGKKLETEGTLHSLEKELENHSDFAKEFYTKENGYAGFLKYPKSKEPVTGRFIKTSEYNDILNKKQHSGGCGTITKMRLALAETYARDPKFYGATFCVGCNKHLPVDEFVWDGTNEILGSPTTMEIRHKNLKFLLEVC